MPLSQGKYLDQGQRWEWFFRQLQTLQRRRRDAIFRRLERARRFLDARLDEPLTLDEVARRAHLSKYHFLRLFKDTFHETPLRYLRRRRLEAAQQLLARTELPVTDICFRVGFESLGSFSTLFSKFAGTSPIAFRRRYVVVPRTVWAPERLIPSCWLHRYALPTPRPTPQF